MHFSTLEKRAQLTSIDQQSFLTFVKSFFSSVYVEGLVQGNITSQVFIISYIGFLFLCAAVVQVFVGVSKKKTMKITSVSFTKIFTYHFHLS